MKWILPLLAFVAFGELILKYFTYTIFYKPGHVIDYKNTTLYFVANATNHVLGIVQDIFYGYLFFQFSESGKLRRGIFIMVSVSVLISFYFFFFSSDLAISLSYSWLISDGFTVIITLGYMYAKFAVNDQFLWNKDPGLWIALGVCLFSTGTSIVFALYNFIAKNDLNIFGMRLYNFVPRVLCIVLYACISRAIILCKKETRSPYKKMIIQTN